MLTAIACALPFACASLAWTALRLPTPVAIALASVALATASLGACLHRLGSRAEASVHLAQPERPLSSSQGNVAGAYPLTARQHLYRRGSY